MDLSEVYGINPACPEIHVEHWICKIAAGINLGRHSTASIREKSLTLAACRHSKLDPTVTVLALFSCCLRPLELG